jgi:hypothetical protein
MSAAQDPVGNAATSSPQQPDRKRERLKWFYDQRAYPSGHIPENGRGKALAQMDDMIQREIQMGLRSAPVIDGIIPFPGNTTNWLFIGPRPINEIFGGNSGSPTASGRVTSLAIDPSDATGKTVYLGAAVGGVWKTTDGGATWATNFDSQPSLSIGSVAVAPSSPSTVYVGTGEDNFGGENFYGAGMIKSINAGATWTQIGGTGGTITNVPGIPTFTGPYTTRLGGPFIGSLAVNPSNANIVQAGVRIASNAGSGIYCSDDGGLNWSLQVAGPAGTSVVYASSMNAFAAIGALGGDPSNGIYISKNANSPCASQTWTKLTISGSGIDTTKVGRIALAIAPSTTGALNTTTIYAAIANSSTVPVASSDLLAILKSTDGGTTWTQLNSTTTPNFCAGQCWYDLTIAVHPTNANFVVVGGSAFTKNSSTLFRSTDGGTTWTSGGTDNFTIGSNSVRPHVDTHALAFAANGATPRLYTGDDGGVWRTDDPTVTPHLWVDLNNTLGLTQFYPGMGVHPSDQNIIYGGNQDNGTPKYTGTLDWNDMGVCGDGGYFAIDPIVPSTVYASCQRYSINRSLQNGDVISTIPSFTDITGINQSDQGKFIPPLVIDSSLTNRLYFGTCRIWQTMDRGDTWTAISGDLSASSGTCPGSSSGNVSAIDVLHMDSNIVVAATTNGRVWRTLNAGSGVGATWSDITGTGLSTRFITDIKTKRSDATGNILYATFSGFSGNNPNFADNLGHVFKSTNGGATWSDISGNLPNIPVNAIVVDHINSPLFDALYIGTDIGVFKCADPEAMTPCANWTVVGAGLPRVPVLSLEEQRASRNLLAGTHGRGAWNFQLSEIAVPAAPFLSGISPATTNAGMPSSGTLTLTLQGNFDASSKVLMDGNATGIVTHAAAGNQITADIPASRFVTGGESAITVGESTSMTVSSALAFTILSPQPTIASATPASVNAGNGGNPFDVAVTGTNFNCSTAPGPTGGTAGSKLRFNGIDHDFKASPPCSSTSATFTIPPAEISTPGSISMFTFTPSPGGGQSTISFTFTVQNASPVLVTPNPVPFNSQKVATTSAPQSITVTNSGGVAVTLAAGTPVSFTGANPSDFAIASAGTTCVANFVLAPSGGSCIINVTFTPGATGARMAMVNVADNAPGTPQQAMLTGTGVLASVALSPNPLNLGGVNLTKTSAPQTITITNSGTLAATLASATPVTITGTNASEFAIATGTTCTANFILNAGGGSCVINVTFTPGATGLRTATISVADDAPGTPQQATLNGTGTKPAASVAPSPLAIGSVTVNDSKTAAVTLSNTGTGPLTVTAIAIAPSPGDFTQTNTCGTLPAQVAANGNCVITVKLVPTATGARAATLTITDDDNATPNSTQTVNLTGTGVDFTLTQATTGVVQITAGTPASVALNLTLTPSTATLPADVNYSCAFPASLAGATCSMNPTKTSAGSASGSTTTLMISTTANIPPSPRRQDPVTPYLPLATATALAALLAIFLAARQKIAPFRGRMAYLTLALLVIGAAGLVSCGTPSPPPPIHTPKGASSVTVTSTSGAVSKTTTVNINVN